MIPIAERFRDTIVEMLGNSQKQHVVTEDNVWQEGNTLNRRLLCQIVEHYILPGSGIRGLENLVELYRKAQEGSSCLLLVEHYSNFDLPCFFILLEKAHPEGLKMAESLLPIAGFKLNEESPVVLAFAEAFSRIVIYPSRSIEALPGEERETELKRAQRINLAAMKAMSKAKSQGKLILVFPAGTRYRPGRPETKRGVKEIDSYIKSYDFMCLVSINGNTLEVTESKGGMEYDVGREDVLLYTASPVLNCAEFRQAAQLDCPEGEDSKQFTVDRVMERLDALHEETEPLRLDLLKRLKTL